MSENTPRSLRAPSLPPASRAPRLRRIAELIDIQAERSEHPQEAHEVAREMRKRAAELECSGEYRIDAAELLQALLS